MKNTGTHTIHHLLLVTSFLWAFVYSCAAQASGTFDLSHNIIASGGGLSSSGQTVVTGTLGQNLAGTVSTGFGTGGQLFGVRGGFWAFEALAPTAASVPVGGRVMTADGMPIANVRVNLIGPDSIRTAISNPFGYYRIDEITVGQTYVLEALHKQYAFNVRTINVADEILDLDLIALQ